MFSTKYEYFAMAVTAWFQAWNRDDLGFGHADSQEGVSDLPGGDGKEGGMVKLIQKIFGKNSGKMNPRDYTCEDYIPIE